MSDIVLAAIDHILNNVVSGVQERNISIVVNGDRGSEIEQFWAGCNKASIG